MTEWTNVTPSEPEWTDVTPPTPNYKKALRGQIYAGHRDVYAGALTIPLKSNSTITDTAFYAGLIGTAFGITWTGVSPVETSWTDIDPDATVWTDV